jgi:hypothetical protein
MVFAVSGNSCLPFLVQLSSRTTHESSVLWGFLAVGNVGKRGDAIPCTIVKRFIAAMTAL